MLEISLQQEREAGEDTDSKMREVGEDIDIKMQGAKEIIDSNAQEAEKIIDSNTQEAEGVAHNRYSSFFSFFLINNIYTILKENGKS